MHAGTCAARPHPLNANTSPDRCGRRRCGRSCSWAPSGACSAAIWSAGWSSSSSTPLPPSAPTAPARTREPRVCMLVWAGFLVHVWGWGWGGGRRGMVLRQLAAVTWPLGCFVDVRWLARVSAVDTTWTLGGSGAAMSTAVERAPSQCAQQQNPPRRGCLQVKMDPGAGAEHLCGLAEGQGAGEP